MYGYHLCQTVLLIYFSTTFGFRSRAERSGVNRAGGLRSDVARNAAREGELLEQQFHRTLDDLLERSRRQALNRL